MTVFKVRADYQPLYDAKDIEADSPKRAAEAWFSYDLVEYDEFTIIIKDGDCVYEVEVRIDYEPTVLWGQVFERSAVNPIHD